MRHCVFDCSFYPSGRDELKESIQASLKNAEAVKPVPDAVSYVAPHAGYMYSGKTAAFSYRAMQSNKHMGSIDTIVIVGPNHTGRGRPISVSYEDWQTPLGISRNDKELSKAIAGSSEYIDIDEYAHEGEHSIEVQLPFLQCLFPSKRFAAICMGDQSIEASAILSKAIDDASYATRRNTLLLASSDFNHYESAEAAKRKDSRLLGAIRALDCKALNRLADELDDSACGIGPITTAMMFALSRKARDGVVLDYSNSGDASGDYSSVVAYSAIAFVR
ncbi:MAG: AmmeMemoRadiSam system protein B [Candidatus Micrarchaeaceae archaeon]